MLVRIVWPSNPKLDQLPVQAKSLVPGEVIEPAAPRLYQLLETRGSYREGDLLWLSRHQVEVLDLIYCPHCDRDGVPVEHECPEIPAAVSEPAHVVPAPSSFREAGAVVPSGGAGSFLRGSRFVPVSENVEGPNVLGQVRA